MLNSSEEKTSRADARILAESARTELVRKGTLHWFHWAIVALSLLLTFFAWNYSKSALDERVELQFDREAEQVVELVRERMQKYEDVLWSGVALVRASGDEVEYEELRTYVNNLNVEKKYPGINGIGVIHAIPEAAVSDYLAEHRKRLPDFKIHPQHEGEEFYPITYIIPEKENAKAVGLDMAHESNRFTAAKKARDSGMAQITGPINLVQAEEKTAGFLFFAPYFAGGTYETVEERQQNFLGMVYAPFVVKKLMKGTLEKEKRHVGLRLVDGDEVIYDEHVATEQDFDPDPLFKKTIDVAINGRSWTFDIWSAKSFRQASTDSQPLTILLGGIVIDTLLIGMFLSISRASKRALGYADSMTVQLLTKAEELQASQDKLAERATQLENSNHELEQFAYVASHDLQEPLRKVASYGGLLRDDCGEDLSEDGHHYLDVVIDGANRMKALVSDLLSFSRITSRGEALKPVDAEECLSVALDGL